MILRVEWVYLTEAELQYRNLRDPVGSSHSQQIYYEACILKSAVQDCGLRLDQSEFESTHGRGLMSCSHQPSKCKKESQRPLLAGNIKFYIPCPD